MRLSIATLILAILVPSLAPSAELPESRVLDEPSILSPTVRSTLGKILREHEQVSGDRVVVAIFSTRAPEPSIDALARKRFEEWELASRKQQSGILIALAWKEREARIQVGPRAAAILGEERMDELLNGTLIRRLESGSPSDALMETTAAVLQALDSPLIASGRLAELLKDLPPEAAEPVQRKVEPSSSVIAPRVPFAGLTLFFLFLGAGAISIALARSLHPEAHYTAEGWFRPTLIEDTRAWLESRRGKTAQIGSETGGVGGYW